MENKGFTLIELLIVIAIIGILVGIALPSYQAHVRKANRIDVQLEMTRLSLVAERQYARQNSYPADFPAPDTATVPSYSLNFDNLENNSPSKIGFKITATPQGSQASDECGTMTLNQAGAVTVKGGSSSTANLQRCW